MALNVISEAVKVIKLDRRGPASPLVFTKDYAPNSTLPQTNIELGDIAQLSSNHHEFNAEIFACGNDRFTGVVKAAVTELGLVVGAKIEFSLEEVFAITKR